MGRTTGKGSPAFQSANYNGNEVRWHGDLQERNRHFSFLIYILRFILIWKLKKRKRHWPAVWSDRWPGCCRSDLVPDHHATHSSKPPALWGQTPEKQSNVPSVTGRTTVDFNSYDFPFSLDFFLDCGKYFIECMSSFFLAFHACYLGIICVLHWWSVLTRHHGPTVSGLFWIDRVNGKK